MAGYGPETVEAAERSRMTARQKKILGYIRDEGPEQEKEDEILDFSLGEDRRKRTESAQAIETKRPAMIVLEEVAAENVKAGPLTMGTKTI